MAKSLRVRTAAAQASTAPAVLAVAKAYAAAHLRVTPTRHAMAISDPASITA